MQFPDSLFRCTIILTSNQTVKNGIDLFFSSKKVIFHIYLINLRLPQFPSNF